MTPRTASGRGRALRCAFALAALGALALRFPAPALGEASSIPCATSRAVEEIDTVAAAMYAWLLDVTGGLASATPAASIAGAVCPGSPPVDLTQVPVIALADLRALLVPLYIAAIPAKDPWKHPYEYRLNVADPLSAHFIALRSAGADGLFEGTTYDVGTTSGPKGDLVFYNTTRVRQPPRLDPVARQLVTVEEVHRLGDAMLSWFIDTISGEPPSTPAGGPTVDLSLIAPISPTDLAALLTPFYTLCVPELDGWGNPYDLRLNDNLLGSPVMSIRSAGSDGTVEGNLYDIETFPADDLTRDLVWADGTIFREPTTARTHLFTDGFESATLWGTWSCGPEF